MQPHLDNLQVKYGEQLTMQCVMGGMLPSWDKFHDEVNAVSRPVQMGPVWMHAAQLTNRPINHLLWIKDPPASSYPACIAVKCAQLQSAETGIEYFKRVQAAAMIHAANIASRTVLESVAKEIAVENQRFDISRFTADYDHGNGANAFRADLELATRYKVSRFPTLLLESAGKRPVIISGYRTLDALTTVLTEVFEIMPYDQLDRS